MTKTRLVYPRKQHITIVSETFPPEINGVANTLRYLCLGLVQHGHKVTIVRPRQRHERKGLTPSSDNALFADEHIVASLPLPGYADLRVGIASSSQLQRLWHADRPDAVYVATQGPLGVAAVAAARKMGLPVGSGFHTNFHQYSRYYGFGALEKLLCAYGRWFHNRTDITLVPTTKMQNATSVMGIATTGLWSRGVDCQRFTPDKRDESLRANWGLEGNDRAVLYVGRLAAEKNIRTAVACYERMRKLYPRTKFVLVGNGPMRKQLSERHPDYIFCGAQSGNELARHYASGDLFLFPSKTDTFGNVVLEAMASGLAVVAYNDAAAHEHIRHEENGIKAPLDQDELFISGALRLANQPSLLKRIRIQARIEALKLNWESRIKQFEKLVLNQNPKAQLHARNKQSISIL